MNRSHEDVVISTRLESWITDCRNANVEIDIDRVARFAIFAQQRSAVEYLVTQHHANLESKDVLGRSAITYATRRDMLGHVLRLADSDIIRRAINQKDIYGVTPFLYAARWSSLNVFKLCLENNADFEIITKKGESALDLYLQRPLLNYSSLLPDEIEIGLRIVLDGLLKTYPYFQVFVLQHPPGGAFVHFKMPIGELQNVPILEYDRADGTWTHVPWTNVSCFLSDNKFVLTKTRVSWYSCVRSYLSQHSV